MKQALLIVALVVALRLPFLTQAIQGDDVYYLYGAEHAQIEPLHPTHASYVFQGDEVDMRGHPHPPLNVWILAAILALVGDIREVPFHAVYIGFSIIAALAMLSLARRFIPDRAMLAVLLFLVIPAFVINGASLEADLPFLAFWMAAIAFFVRAVDEGSVALLVCAAFSGVLAGLAAYQGVLLTPILAVYLFEKRRDWALAWVVTLASSGALAAWQLFERLSGGTLPAGMLAGYLQTYGLEAFVNKIHSAAALVLHLGWMISPVAVVASAAAAFARGWRWPIAFAAVAAVASAFYDSNPLAWITFGLGALVLAYVGTGAMRQREFLQLWIVIFFAGAIVIFFAGSARYLLPIAAPLAILIARAAGTRILWASVALQLPLSLALAASNYQHADGYRVFAASLAKPVPGHHVWVAAELGLRYYLESDGALPLERDQPLEPGDVVVSSELTGGSRVTAPLARVAEFDIVPTVPLRLISLDGRAAYSSSARGLLPFEISRVPIDRVHADMVSARDAQLSYLDAHDPRSAAQFISGMYPDAWMGAQATVLLKPAPGRPLRLEIYIPPAAPARHIQMLANGRVIAEDTFPGPGSYTLVAPYADNPDAAKAGETVTVTITADHTYSVPPDQRQLGVVVTGLGFR